MLSGAALLLKEHSMKKQTPRSRAQARHAHWINIGPTLEHFGLNTDIKRDEKGQLWLIKGVYTDAKGRLAPEADLDEYDAWLAATPPSERGYVEEFTKISVAKAAQLVLQEVAPELVPDTMIIGVPADVAKKVRAKAKESSRTLAQYLRDLALADVKESGMMATSAAR